MPYPSSLPPWPFPGPAAALVTTPSKLLFDRLLLSSLLTASHHLLRFGPVGLRMAALRAAVRVLFTVRRVLGLSLA